MCESEKVDVLRNCELIKVISMDVVKDVASGISESVFRETLTTLNDNASTINALYNMQKSDILNDNLNNIEMMLNETQIIEKYNDITKLIESKSTNKDLIAWRPRTGDCNMQLEAYRKKYLLEKRDLLKKQLEDQRNCRIILKQTLDTKRNNHEKLINLMKATKLKLENLMSK